MSSPVRTQQECCLSNGTRPWRPSRRPLSLWETAPEMFTLRTQTAALTVMRNFPNSIWPRGHNPSAVRWDRNRAVTIRRFAELLRRANSEAVGGNRARLFRPGSVEIDSDLPPMSHRGRRAKLICEGRGPPCWDHAHVG